MDTQIASEPQRAHAPRGFVRVTEEADSHSQDTVTSQLRELVPVLSRTADVALEAVARTNELLSLREGSAGDANVTAAIFERLLEATDSVQQCGQLLDDKRQVYHGSRNAITAAASLAQRIRELRALLTKHTTERDDEQVRWNDEVQSVRERRQQLCEELTIIAHEIDANAARVRGPLGLKARFSSRARGSLEIHSELGASLRALEASLGGADSDHASVASRMYDSETLSRRIGGRVPSRVQSGIETARRELDASYFISSEGLARRSQVERALAAAQANVDPLIATTKQLLIEWSTLASERFIPEALDAAAREEVTLRREAQVGELVTACMEEMQFTPPYNDEDLAWIPRRSKHMWEEPTEGVIAHASIRSFENIQESLRMFFRFHLQHRVEAATGDRALQELRREVEQVRESFFVEYRSSITSFQKIIQSCTLRSLNALLEEANHSEYVRGTSRTGAVANDIAYRMRTEDLLLEGEAAIYSMLNTTTNPVNEDVTLRPGHGYGPIRFIFNWDAVAPRTLFTESDSLNPAGLPSSLRSKWDKDVRARQLTAEHALVSQAILQQDARHYPEMSLSRTNWGHEHRYIEAQIMARELDLNRNVREIILDFRANAHEFWKLVAAYPDPNVLREELARAAPNCRVSSQGFAELETDPELTKLCSLPAHRAALLKRWAGVFPLNPSFNPS